MYTLRNSPTPSGLDFGDMIGYMPRGVLNPKPDRGMGEHLSALTGGLRSLRFNASVNSLESWLVRAVEKGRR